MSKIMFNSEVELGKCLGSIGVIPDAYQAISQTTLEYELHSNRPSGINVLAFKSSAPDYTTPSLEGESGLVPSENLQVDFVPTKVNSSVSNKEPKFIPTKLNEAAVKLFQELSNDLLEEEKKHINTPLIITGSGLGGYRAILSTMRLHRAIDVEESNGSKKTKRPICITFGCPLFGDEAFQSAIAERPQWKSSFLNVVANKDPVASFFSSSSPYKPFGTFLFCTESGGHTAFEDQESILPVLDAMRSTNEGNIKSANEGNLQVYDYVNILESIRRKILYRGVSELGESNLNLLRAGITLQLREVGVLNDNIGEMEKKKTEIIRKKNLGSAYDPSKKLNDMKINLTYMEWYMKGGKKNGGYYDSYKNAKTREEIIRQQEILKHQRDLTKYWKKTVEDKDRMPQKEGAKLRKRWLYGGTNYRRIVEPMEIADHYKNGKTDYIKIRSDHYKLLEKWSDEDKKELQSNEEQRNKAASLTEDSCFWAHVEEALISLRELVSLGSINAEKETEKLVLKKKLENFEDYVILEIKKYAVSPEVFLEGSSLMTWWEEYKAHKGTDYASEFAKYMSDGDYEKYK